MPLTFKSKTILDINARFYLTLQTLNVSNNKRQKCIELRLKRLRFNDFIFFCFEMKFNCRINWRCLVPAWFCTLFLTVRFPIRNRSLSGLKYNCDLDLTVTFPFFTPLTQAPYLTYGNYFIIKSKTKMSILQLNPQFAVFLTEAFFCSAADNFKQLLKLYEDRGLSSNGCLWKLSFPFPCIDEMQKKTERK